MHGYQIIQELTERTGGVWRPSPGSVYPTLQQLQDEELVREAPSDSGKRVYELTDTGREQADRATAPWGEVAGESADALVAEKPAAVVNAATSISGRYPNVGPQILNEAGVPLLDAAGPEVMHLHDGDPLRLDGEGLWREDTRISSGHLLDAQEIQAQMHEARAGLAVQIEAFATNTMEFIRKERELLLDGIGIPPIRVS